MSEDDIKRLQEINEMLSTMNAVLEALNRVMKDLEPNPDDVAFLHEFANSELDDEDDEWLDDEDNEYQGDGFFDDTWDNAMQLFPMQLILTYKP